MKSFKIFGRARFQINRLPDAARVAVSLFAFEFEGPVLIVHAQHELMFLAWFQV